MEVVVTKHIMHMNPLVLEMVDLVVEVAFNTLNLVLVVHQYQMVPIQVGYFMVMQVVLVVLTLHTMIVEVAVVLAVLVLLVQQVEVVMVVLVKHSLTSLVQKLDQLFLPLLTMDMQEQIQKELNLKML